MLYLQIASPKSSVLNFLDSNSFEVIISIFQRTEKVPDMERLLWTYLSDLNEQAQERLDTIMEQMKAIEGVTEKLKCTRQMEWVRRCNNIHNRAEEIVLQEIIYS